MTDSQQLRVGDRDLTVTRPDKVLYPAAGFRKADLIDYYRRIAPALLPHLEGRPPTLVRAPDGVDGETFFAKNCPQHHPDWLRVAPGSPETGGTRGCLVDDEAALVWLANLAAIEWHTHQWRVEDPSRPTAMVIDLDPGAPATILDCCRIALTVRALLERLGLECVVKTSGRKGLHMSVPLIGAAVTDDDTKRFALAVGQWLEQREPDHVTTDMSRASRPGKVFVDWSQNDAHKTTVCAYSLRVAEQPAVSAPVTWDEVADAAAPGDLAFGAAQVVERYERDGDHYAASLRLEQELPHL